MDHVRVDGTNIVLLVNKRLEAARFFRAKPLLEEFGTVKECRTAYEYDKYVALDPMDRCYDNAMETALRYGLSYVEGMLIYSTDGGRFFPLAHGWCENAAGDIVDPTLHRRQAEVRCGYYVVRILKEYSVEWKRRVGYYGCLDGDVNGGRIGVHFEEPRIWLQR